MKKNLLFMAVGLLALSGNVFADLSETFTHITPVEVVPFTDDFTLTSFNTALGTLKSITIDLSSTGFASVQIANLTGKVQAFSNATASLPLVATGPDGVTVFTTTAAGPFSGTVGAALGPYVFSGPSVTSSSSISVAPGLFSTYETVGPVNLQFSTASQGGTFGGSGNEFVFFGGSGDLSAVTSVTYTYAPTPEPAFLGVLSLGLGGVVLFRRRKLKNS
jgi:hypothetical protein